MPYAAPERAVEFGDHRVKGFLKIVESIGYLFFNSRPLKEYIPGLPELLYLIDDILPQQGPLLRRPDGIFLFEDREIDLSIFLEDRQPLCLRRMCRHDRLYRQTTQKVKEGLLINSVFIQPGKTILEGTFDTAAVTLYLPSLLHTEILLGCVEK